MHFPASPFRPATHLWLLLCLPALLTAGEHLRFESLSTEDGLCHSVVNAVTRDARGFIWLGTQEGLSRFDGHQFKTYIFQPDNPTSLSNNYIRCLLEDGDGNLWIGTSAGLNRYREESDDFASYLPNPDRADSLADRGIRALAHDGQDRFWVGTYRGGLHLMDRDSGVFQVFRHDPDDPQSPSSNQIETIFIDSRDRVWVGTGTGGLSRMVDGRFINYSHDPDDPTTIAHNEVKTMLEDEDGRLWVGVFDSVLEHFDPVTGHFRHIPLPEAFGALGVVGLLKTDDGRLMLACYGGGLVFYDDQTGEFRQFSHDPTLPNSLSSNLLRTMYRDPTGLIWLGSFEGGVSKLNPNTLAFQNFSHTPFDPNSLSADSVRALAESPEGNIWVGTEKGLNLLDPHNGHAVRYYHDPDNPKSLSHDNIKEVFVDRNHRTWIGTFGGGLNLMDTARGDFTHYLADPEREDALSNNAVLVIGEADENQLFLGTYGGGLNLFNPDKGTFKTYLNDPQDPNSLSQDRIWSISADPATGKLWIGTYGGGLSIFDPADETFTNYRYDPGNKDGISHGNVYIVYRDPTGVAWLGTSYGVNRVVQVSNQSLRFLHYNEGDGLRGNSVYGILMDEEGMLWFSTNQGLTRLNPKSSHIKNYNVGHGLQSSEFKEGAYLKTRSGDLLFGGKNGLNLFNPAQIRENTHAPPVVFTQFLKFNRPVPMAENLNNLEALTLSHKDAVFSFRFAALDFAALGRNTFAYRLEGFDDKWIHTGAVNEVTFTNLDPGEYLFHVKAANNDGVWNEQGATLPLIMTPPPWATWWARLIYVAVFLLVLIIGFHIKTRAQRRELDRQRTLVESLKRIDRMKDDFLANTSHELRTPLNGIIGLAEALLEGAAGRQSQAARENLGMIIASGRRLAGLVNDILDFSVLRDQTLRVNTRPVNIHLLAETVITLSKPLLAGRNLELVNQIDPATPMVEADEDRLNQVLHNLIDNAVKFTKEGGIRVTAERADGVLTVHVIDTGKGIAPENQERIFQSFEQEDGSIARQYGGTGLGLAISREIIQIHGGDLRVQSKPGQGADFAFTLKIADGAPLPDPLATPRFQLGGEAEQLPRLLGEDAAEEAPAEEEDAVHPDLRHCHILAIDDEPLNLQVLKNLLALDHYKITIADGGEAGLEVLDREHVDLVLLDVMMPKMSGYHVCRRIRERFAGHELPVVLLTAKSQIGDLVEGFRAGANDYVLKPVSKGELLARIRMHLELVIAQRRLSQYSQTLEQEVHARTKSLEERNEELESLNEIIKSINIDVRMESVRKNLVQQGMSLFSNAYEAAFIQADADYKSLNVREVAGAASSDWVGAVCSYEEMTAFYNQHIQPMGRGVFIYSPPGATVDCFGKEIEGCVLVMTLFINQKAEAFLVFSSRSKDAFSVEEAEKCKRFREHATIAYAKAKMFEELEQTTRNLKDTQEKLVEAAHMAGMAEIATEVLHNVGNALNSVNISAENIHEKLSHGRPLMLLERVSVLLEEHRNELMEFLTSSEQGRRIPEALPALFGQLKKLNDGLRSEVVFLRDNIEEIREFVLDQIRHTEKTTVSLSTVNINALIHEVVDSYQQRLKASNCKLNLSLMDMAPAPVRKNRLKKVLSILMENAVEAVENQKDNDPAIIVTTAMGAEELRISVFNSGPQLGMETIKKLFNQGFTTKKDHYGGSLHYAANALNEMGGRIYAEPAEGGTVFHIRLPAHGEGQS